LETETELREDPNIMSRNTKNNTFQERSAGFKAVRGVRKKKHEGDVPVYVMNVDIISIRQKHDHRP
jgi:hypothetical protein